MNIRLHLYTLAALSLYSLNTQAQTAVRDSTHCPIPTPAKAIIKRTISSSIPMIAIALPYNISNRHIKDFRNSYLSSFHNRYDDYLQFVPLTAQIGMHLAGLPGRSSQTSELLAADALGFGIMMTSVTLSKKLTRVMRPDGSSRNSFPSGHTAMAFYSATALHLEYGKKYPWISLVSYFTAAGVGIGRILNNRHWIGDVMVGAAAGITSAELGYWLSSLLHRRPYIYEEQPCYFPNTDLRCYLPWTVALQKDKHNGSLGFGIRWKYNDKYFLAGEGLLEGHYTLNSKGEHIFARYQNIRFGWGREFRLNKRNLSLDAAAFVGLSSDANISPALQIAPRLELTNRLSWQVSLGYEYHTQAREVYSLSEKHQYTIPSWRLGSAIELRL